jgi:hypothetical protein
LAERGSNEVVVVAADLLDEMSTHNLRHLVAVSLDHHVVLGHLGVKDKEGMIAFCRIEEGIDDGRACHPGAHGTLT